MSWSLVGLTSKRRVGSPALRLLLLTMADKANDDGSGVFASVATLARDIESSPATVKRILKKLEGERLIKRAGTRECPHGYTVVWSVQVSAIEALPLLSQDRTPARAQAAPRNLNPVQNDRGTGVKMTPHPVHLDPGTGVKMTHEGGHHDPPTGVKMSHKPTLKPIQEPTLKPTTRARRGSRTTPDPSASFGQAWALWPRKDRSSKAKSVKLWATLETQYGGQAALGAVRAYLDTPDARKEGGAYVPGFERWLANRAESFLDQAAAAGGYPAASRETWEIRLQRFREHGFWPGKDAGPRPDEPEFRGPDDLYLGCKAERADWKRRNGLNGFHGEAPQGEREQVGLGL